MNQYKAYQFLSRHALIECLMRGLCDKPVPADCERTSVCVDPVIVEDKEYWLPPKVPPQRVYIGKTISTRIVGLPDNVGGSWQLLLCSNHRLGVSTETGQDQ